MGKERKKNIHNNTQIQKENKKEINKWRKQ